VLDVRRLIYLHGLESTSQSGKARQFAQRFPGMLTPDFTGSFAERMRLLYPILGETSGWTIIGSSFGGLMGVSFTHDHPGHVRKLVLLAPAIILPEFAARQDLRSIAVPTVIIHGSRDEVVPAEPVRILAERIFSDLTYIAVDDDHRLHRTFEETDWEKVLE
jgi:pimeloyl-ACP methyl ester carboxylesterase